MEYFFYISAKYKIDKVKTFWITRNWLWSIWIGDIHYPYALFIFILIIYWLRQLWVWIFKCWFFFIVFIFIKYFFLLFNIWIYFPKRIIWVVIVSGVLHYNCCSLSKKPFLTLRQLITFYKLSPLSISNAIGDSFLFKFLVTLVTPLGVSLKKRSNSIYWESSLR